MSKQNEVIIAVGGCDLPESTRINRWVLVNQPNYTHWPALLPRLFNWTRSRGLVGDKLREVLGRPSASTRRMVAGKPDVVNYAKTIAIVSPMADGFGATVMPAAAKISTFSCALSPKADTMAPAWPILRPLGADRPAI
jgi:hypothetical protein